MEPKDNDGKGDLAAHPASEAQLYDLFRRTKIRIALLKIQARRVAPLIDSSERLVDAMKSGEIRRNGKRFSHGAYALVVLTDRQILALGSASFHLNLVDISELSSLEKGWFTCKMSDGTEWSIAHAKGVIHRYGNRPNTERFYESLRNVVNQANPESEGT